MNITFIDRQSGKEHTESPPGEGFLKFLYHQPLGELALQVLVKRKALSALYGRLMDGKRSAQRIGPFVQEYNIDLNEAVKSLEQFTSFNDFFYRTLKPEARPMGEGLVSPGDGKLLAFESPEQVGEFFVKGSKFTLTRFLQDEALASQFADGPLLILRLAPNDYHRFHFPFAGVPEAMHPIRGWYYSVSPYAVMPNFGRVFCENKRAYTLLRTEDRGNILLAPVGATMVGSILTTYTPGQAIAKGAEMGYFAFGGSTIVMNLQAGQFQIDEDLLANTRQGKETFVKMGEKIGQ
ncbi:MAG: phosphatidylserine decarboxylase [Bacteroidota bacterium]